MTAIIFNPEGKAIRRSDTLQALIRRARLTKPQRVRCDREHRFLEITYANGDIGRAHFPTTEACSNGSGTESLFLGMLGSWDSN